jgi:hypothetical protein
MNNLYALALAARTGISPVFAKLAESRYQGNAVP